MYTECRIFCFSHKDDIMCFSSATVCWNSAGSDFSTSWVIESKTWTRWLLWSTMKRYLVRRVNHGESVHDWKIDPSKGKIETRKGWIWQDRAVVFSWFLPVSPSIPGGQNLFHSCNIFKPWACRCDQRQLHLGDGQTWCRGAIQKVELAVPETCWA